MFFILTCSQPPRQPMLFLSPQRVMSHNRDTSIYCAMQLVKECICLCIRRGIAYTTVHSTRQNFLYFWCHLISFPEHFFVGFSLGWKLLSISCLTNLKYNRSCSEIAFPLSLSVRCNSNLY